METNETPGSATGYTYFELSACGLSLYHAEGPS